MLVKQPVGGWTTAFELTAFAPHALRESSKELMKQIMARGTGLSAMHDPLVFEVALRGWEGDSAQPQSQLCQCTPWQARPKRCRTDRDQRNVCVSSSW